MASNLSIQAPIGGISRERGFQSQPPFTSVESINFWPMDAVTGRALSATRPPLVAIASPGEDVNLFQRVNGDASQSPQVTMVAAYDGDLYWWNGLSWVLVSSSETITTGRPVYATTFLKRVFILKDTLPVVFNYDDLTMVDWVATAGSVPSDCRVGMTWQGAVWIAGSEAEPHVFSASRIGDPFDWDYTAADDGRAFTSTGEDEGLITGPVTSLIPFTSDTSIICTNESLHALRRHPNLGGALENLSGNTGVLGQGAWCKGPNDTLFAMGKNGLFGMSPSGQYQEISREKIPDDLIALTHDYLNPVISMAYDLRWNKVHICVRGDEAQAWIYDLATGGFHEQEYLDYPTVMMHFDPLDAEGQSGVLFGGTGYGGVARLDTTGSEAMSYRLVAGPIRISDNPRVKSKIGQSMHLFGGNTVIDDSAVVRTWVGVTGDDVYNRYINGYLGNAHEVDASNLLINGGKSYPHLSGHAKLIEISGTTLGTDRLVYEGTEDSVMPDGSSKQLAGSTTFQGDSDATFDSTQWLLYAEATPDAPASTLTDFSFFVDLSELPDEWWAVVHSTGRDIRAANAGGNLFPTDLVYFNKSTKTGLLVVKQTVTTSPTAVRIWAGNPSVFAPSLVSSIGRYAAYDSSVVGFYPDGGGGGNTCLDRTINQGHMSFSGSGSEPLRPTLIQDGPLNSPASVYNGSTYDSSVYSLDLDPDVAVSELTVFYMASIQEISGTFTGFVAGTTFAAQSTGGTPVLYSAIIDLDEDDSTPFQYGGGSNGDLTTVSSVGDTPTLNTDFHFALKSGSPATAFLNGSAGSAPASNVSLSSVESIFFGNLSGSSDPYTLSTTLSLVRIDKVARSDNYIAYHAAMRNQSTFWNGWSAVTP